MQRKLSFFFQGTILLASAAVPDKIVYVGVCSFYILNEFLIKTAHPYENYFTAKRAACRAKSSGLIWAKKNPTIAVGLSCAGGWEGKGVLGYAVGWSRDDRVMIGAG
jgi:hypothetical protein